MQRFPADEEVVGGLALQDLLELTLQNLGRGKAGVGAFLALLLVGLLPVYPVAKV